MSSEVVVVDERIQLANSIRKDLKVTNKVMSSGIDQTDAAANQVEPDDLENSTLQEEAQPQEDNENIEYLLNSSRAPIPTCTPPATQSSASNTLASSFSSSSISTSSSSSSSSTSSINVQTQTFPIQQGIYLHQLKENHIFRLSALLNQRNTSGIPHWHHVMENIFKAGNERDVKIADLYRAQHGGGNPPLMFLEHLKTREEDVTKNDFRTKARQKHIGRFDVANHPVLKDRQGSMLIKDLTTNQMLILAALLTPAHDLADWRYFADEYNFADELKVTIATSINVANVTSPTRKMLEYLKTQEKTTNDLKLACTNLLNVVSLINKIENNLSR